MPARSARGAPDALLLDTSFLVEFEAEVCGSKAGAATSVLASRRSAPVAISIVTLGEFAQRFSDVESLNAFVSHFRVIQLSRVIAWRMAWLQSSLARRLGENAAWIAATALAYGATLVARDNAFARVPRLDYLRF